jgi:uncharacterized protein with HEPN domain
MQNYPHRNKRKISGSWSEMYLLRNNVSHEYFEIDYEIILDVASNNETENKIQTEGILEKYKYLHSVAK